MGRGFGLRCLRGRPGPTVQRWSGGSLLPGPANHGLHGGALPLPTPSPAQVPSLRLMWVTSTPGGRVAGSTAKLWFCALISTRPARVEGGGGRPRRVGGRAAAASAQRGLAAERGGESGTAPAASLLAPPPPAAPPRRLTGGVEADGVVAAVVPELELERLPAKGLAQHLVAHADAKHGLLAQDGLGVLHGIGGGAGVALFVVNGGAALRGQRRGGAWANDAAAWTRWPRAPR